MTVRFNPKQTAGEDDVAKLMVYKESEPEIAVIIDFSLVADSWGGHDWFTGTCTECPETVSAGLEIVALMRAQDHVDAH